MEYTELLDKACQASSRLERLAYVTSFAITPYNNGSRAYKPFNPILGETFQLECNNGVRFLAEQVSSVPPIGVAHAENENFCYDIVSIPQTQFRGNSMELYPYGRSHIRLKSTGEVYSIIPPKSKICRLIIGGAYIDNYGELLVVNNTLGDRAEIEFRKRGWFGTGQYQFQGPLKIKASDLDEERGYLKGKWNEYCNYYNYGISTEKCKRIWQSSVKNRGDKFGRRSKFTIFCTSCRDIREPLKTDSRRRADVAAIQDGDLRRANRAMLALQKQQLFEQEKRQKQYDKWTPAFFQKLEDGEVYDYDFPISIVPCYAWKGRFPTDAAAKVLVTDPESIRDLNSASTSFGLIEAKHDTQYSLFRPSCSIGKSTRIGGVTREVFAFAMSKEDGGSLNVHDEDFSGCTLTTILYSSVPWDDPVFWTDASAVKDAVERLSEVDRDWVKPLDEVKEQLSTNPNRHGDFLQFGGVKASFHCYPDPLIFTQELWRLLKSGNSIIQRKCLRSIEILAISDEPRKHLREIGIGDTLLELIRASSSKPDSTRRAKAAQILKLIAGNSNSARLFDDIPPKKQPSRKNKKSFSLHYGRDNQASSSNANHHCAARDPSRERPLPLWYHSVHPTLPWDSETVSALVDLLMSDAVEDSQKCARHVIKKILYYGHISQHVVIDLSDIAELVRMIASMHSTAVIAIKAVTYASIMHSANGQNFIRSGGLEALVNATKSDNIGSICGELAAWSVSHFCENFAGSGKKVIDANGAEALLELAHSFDYCSREAAVHAMVVMLKKSDQDKALVVERLADGGLTQSLLDILKDGQQDHPRKLSILNDTFKALLEIIKYPKYRQEVLDLGGVEITRRSLSQCIKPVDELAKKLLRWLSSPGHRLSRVLKSPDSKKKSIRTGFVKKLKKFFKTEKQHSSRTHESTQEATTDDLHSISGTESRLAPKRSVSSLSSSVQSELCDGLLATAPGGTRTPDLDELLPEGSPTFQTFTLQQFNSSDKDFDPFAFGGGARSQTLAFVNEEDRHELTFSTCTDAKASGNSATNSELIKTHDFI
eukprot:g4670.t1